MSDSTPDAPRRSPEQVLTERLAAQVNGLASDGRGWYRTGEQHAELAASARDLLADLAAAGYAVMPSGEAGRRKGNGPASLPDQAEYLARLVRMDIRKHEKTLVKFAPWDGQDPAEAQAVREKFTADQARRREVLDVLRAARGGGLWVIAQALWLVETGRVPVGGESGLITSAMWHLAAEGVRPRLERLALAGALIARELARHEILMRQPDEATGRVPAGQLPAGDECAQVQAGPDLVPRPDMREVRWAPYKEFGPSDPALESSGPPAGQVVIRATGYLHEPGAERVVIYWERPSA